MDTEHLLTECEALGHTRLQIFGTDRPEVPYTLKVTALTRFLRETNLGWLPTDEVI